MSVLDFLKFDDASIQKVATAKVSTLMDAMDLFVAIAKGVKQPADLGNLKIIFPEVSNADAWTAKVSDKTALGDAVEFIKDSISPDSIVNASRTRNIINEELVENSDEEDSNENDSENKHQSHAERKDSSEEEETENLTPASSASSEKVVSNNENSEKNEENDNEEDNEIDGSVKQKKSLPAQRRGDYEDIDENAETEEFSRLESKNDMVHEYEKRDYENDSRSDRRRMKNNKRKTTLRHAKESEEDNDNFSF